MDQKRDLKPTLYEILGVSKDADQTQIRKAYYALAAKYHPDRKQVDNDEIFKTISLAYAWLSNPVSRARYDRLSEGDQRRFDPVSAENTRENRKEFTDVYNSLIREVNGLCRSRSADSEVTERYKNIFGIFKDRVRVPAPQQFEREFNALYQKHANSRDLSGFFHYFKDEFAMLHDTLDETQGNFLAGSRSDLLQIIQADLRDYCKGKPEGEYADGCKQLLKALDRFYGKSSSFGLPLSSDCDVYRMFEECRGIISEKETKYGSWYSWMLPKRDPEAEKLFEDAARLFKAYDAKFEEIHNSSPKSASPN